MSTKSLAEKLLIKPNTTVWSSHASRLDLIQPLPENVRLVDRRDRLWPILSEYGMRPIS